MQDEPIGEPTLTQQVVAEILGTYGLIFAGTGAVMANTVSGGAITHVGVSLTFGAVVAAMIYAFGHISGSQLNPAVTLAFWSSGATPGRKVPAYLAAQLAGAVLASLTLYLAFGNVSDMGGTVPRGGLWMQSLVLETVLTFFLMIVILGSGLDRRSPAGFAGVAIGLTVALEAMCMGPITGASMNPARSFSPAVFSGVWTSQWLYWVAPIAGAQLAVVAYRVIAPAAFPKRASQLTNAGAADVPGDHRDELPAEADLHPHVAREVVHREVEQEVAV